ncbi:hypothetical protein MYX77_07015 [Acidobacteriia bacterium AH_259_A11_L15]|nr:hypothetical protein [Acidobacteriia bacterium AH_259_A11_L15]
MSWFGPVVVCLVVATIAAGVGMTAEQSTVSENEAKALDATWTLSAATITYTATFLEHGFPHSLAVLGPPGEGEVGPWAADMVEAELAKGVGHGYKFIYRPGPDDEEGRIGRYTLSVRPLKYGETGKRSFLVHESGVIYYTDEKRAATVDDLIVPPRRSR